MQLSKAEIEIIKHALQQRGNRLWGNAIATKYTDKHAEILQKVKEVDNLLAKFNS